MTNEERKKAIRILQWLHDNDFLFRSTEEDVKYATKLAMQELEQEPCDDAISKEKLLKYLKDNSEDFPDYHEAIEYVLSMPSVTPQQKAGGWIPVSERLPENSGRYLAYIVNEYDDKLQYIMTCEYIVDGYWNWFPDDECASDNVIAWMPLPEPYKAESEVQDADSD